MRKELILYRFLLVILIFVVTDIYPQEIKERFKKKHFHSDFATAKRQQAEKEIWTGQLARLFDSKYDDIDEKEFIRHFKEIKLKFFKSPEIKSFVNYVLSNSDKFSKDFIYEVIEIAHTLYPGKEFQKEIEAIYLKTESDKLFAISVQYLMQTKDKAVFLSDLNRRFKDKSDLLLSLQNQLKSSDKKQPDLLDLLAHEFIKNKTVIFSFHRKDRKIPGITIVRNPEGKFMRTAEGNFSGTRQLACSVTNLPGYFKRGNTPQGIYSVQGYYLTKTESIGPSPIVISRIPFEVSVSSFFHKKQKGKWTYEKYKSILPESWKNYFPFSESYRAGKSGRRLIIMHGSTDDLSYYKTLPYYPLTPSFGCLTAMEKWHPETGEMLESEQIELMDMFYSSGKLSGFLVVVELDDKKTPVKIDELRDLLLKAEKILKTKY